jgi:hypothetical protein
MLYEIVRQAKSLEEFADYWKIGITHACILLFSELLAMAYLLPEPAARPDAG